MCGGAGDVCGPRLRRCNPLCHRVGVIGQLTPWLLHVDAGRCAGAGAQEIYAHACTHASEPRHNGNLTVLFRTMFFEVTHTQHQLN